MEINYSQFKALCQIRKCIVSKDKSKRNWICLMCRLQKWSMGFSPSLQNEVPFSQMQESQTHSPRELWCLLVFGVFLKVSGWLKSPNTLFPRPKLAADWKETTKAPLDTMALQDWSYTCRHSAPTRPGVWDPCLAEMQSKQTSIHDSGWHYSPQ